MFEKIKEFTKRIVHFGKSRIQFINFKDKKEKRKQKEGTNQKENEKINMQKVKEVRFISNSSGFNWDRIYEFF